MTAARKYAAVALGCAAVLCLPLLGIPTSWITLMVYIGLAALVTVGLVILTGVGGMTSFAQAAFVGISAYTTAYLTTRYGLSPWLTLPLCMLATGVCALVIGLATVPLGGHFLSIATIAWGVSVYYLFGTVEAFGLNNGITGVPAIAVGGFEFKETRSFFYLVWPAVGLALLASSNLLSSRVGRAIRALHGQAELARACGVDTMRVKLTVFVFAAVLASVSGWLFAHFQRVVTPTSFSLEAGLEYLLMAVIGGSGHLYGALAGSAAVVILRGQLEGVLNGLFNLTGNYEVIVLGALLIAILHAAPDGIWSVVRRFCRLPAPRVPEGSTAPDVSPAAQPERGTPVLTIDGITKRFGGLVVVNDLSFQVRAGEILGLIGPNGAGKSTTFNIISGALYPEHGSVTFLGDRLSGRSPEYAARRGVARTFQHARLVPGMSVLENVALGAHRRGKHGALRAMLRMNVAEELEIFGLATRQLERLGLSSIMHRHAASLSLGEARLVEIARALALDPLLLMLDEPAAGLRHGEKQALAEKLRALREQGITVLLVEHDMGFLMSLVNRLVVLNFGTKIAEGLPCDIRQDRAVQVAYLGEAIGA